MIIHLQISLRLVLQEVFLFDAWKYFLLFIEERMEVNSSVYLKTLEYTVVL